MNYSGRLREEPPSDSGSSTDEGVPELGAVWHGDGPPVRIGVDNSERDYCDGQSLASPSRRPVEKRRYPQPHKPSWTSQ